MLGFLILLIGFECVVLSSRNTCTVKIFIGPRDSFTLTFEDDGGPKSVKILLLGSLSPNLPMLIFEGLHTIIFCATLAWPGCWSSSTLLLFDSSEPEMRKLEKFQWHLSSREMGVHFPKQM